MKQMADEKLEPGSMQPVVGPRTITLSENVRQEIPVAFMVFAPANVEEDYFLFGEER